MRNPITGMGADPVFIQETERYNPDEQENGC
jgi:hypothetical protein